MFVLFVDLLNEDEEAKGYKFFIKKNIVNLLLSKEIILDNYESKIKFFKNKFKIFVLKRLFSINKIKDVAIVFSNNIESLNMKDSISYIISSWVSNIYEIKSQNEMNINFKKYLDSYIILNNIKVENIRILYFIDDFNQEVYDNILENINKFKYIDVSYLGDINSYQYLKLNEKINYINDELGSIIENIKYKYDNSYNVYLNFTKDNIKQKYNISSTNLVIDWYLPENDVLNKNNIILKEKYYGIKKMLEKVFCNIDNFSITKLGYILKNNII